MYLKCTLYLYFIKLLITLIVNLLFIFQNLRRFYIYCKNVKIIENMKYNCDTLGKLIIIYMVLFIIIFIHNFLNLNDRYLIFITIYRYWRLFIFLIILIILLFYLGEITILPCSIAPKQFALLYSGFQMATWTVISILYSTYNIPLNKYKIKTSCNW